VWRALAELIDAVYPRACFLCGSAATDGLACDEHRLPLELEGQRCGRCAAPLGRGLPDGFPCAGCRRSPPPVARTVALADYRQAQIRGWILAFKHRGRGDLAEPLGAGLARRLGAELGLDAWLVPIPLHPWRRIERGYDQAGLLARSIARRTGRRALAALLRTRATPVQGDVGAPSRLANVRGAFALDPWVARGLAGREVWLVDDVVTSGATTWEAARVLRRAGAASVSVACLARAASKRAGGGSWVG
jgi:ComF family protein